MSHLTDADRPPLHPETLRRALLAPNGGYAALDVVATTGSTNCELTAAATAGAPDRTVLVAESQSAGRGRGRRSWVSPARSGLWCSVLLRPAGVPANRLGWLPLITGVALADAIRALAGVDAVLKWPNDLLVGPDRGKCAGILAEVVTGDHGLAVVVGIGLNVSLRPDELPEPTGPGPAVPATSLAIEGAACTDRDQLLVAVLTELDEVERRWWDAAGDVRSTGLAGRYRQRCATVGQRVRVGLPGRPPLLGTAVDVDLDGRLLVRDDDAVEHAMAAGDVAHVRPVPDR